MSKEMYETRKFDGKTYHFATLHETKAEAEKDAAKIRKTGHLARVVRVRGTIEGRKKAWSYKMSSWLYAVYTMKR